MFCKLVCIFAVIKSKRSSTAQTGSVGIINDDQNNVAHNPHPFLRVYNPNRPRPSDEPVVVCLQHFIEGINDLLIEIQRYEREAESYFNTNQRDNNFLQEYLRNIESVKNNINSDPESIKNKQTRLTCLSEQVQCLEEKIKASEAGYKESQSLIKSKIEEMSLDIKEAQERFPEEYQDGFKSFEENPHYMAALQYTPVLNED